MKICVWYTLDSDEDGESELLSGFSFIYFSRDRSKSELIFGWTFIIRVMHIYTAIEQCTDHFGCCNRMFFSLERCLQPISFVLRTTVEFPFEFVSTHSKKPTYLPNTTRSSSNVQHILSISRENIDIWKWEFRNPLLNEIEHTASKSFLWRFWIR